MTDEERQAIRTRVEAASPGPWTQDEISGHLVDANGEGLCAADCDGADAGIWRDEDRAFVIGARQDMPALLAEVERLQKAADDAEAHLPAICRVVAKGATEIDLAASVAALVEYCAELRANGGRAIDEP